MVPVLAGVLGAIVTLGFLFLPGMRDVERSGELARASVDDEDLELAALAEGLMVPVGVVERPYGDPESPESAS